LYANFGTFGFQETRIVENRKALIFFVTKDEHKEKYMRFLSIDISYTHLRNQPRQGNRTSGVTGASCALGQGIILPPLSTKTTEFEVKNRCKSAKEAKT